MDRSRRRHRPIYRDWDLLQLAAAVLALDQLTKFVVVQTLAWQHSWPALGFFRFTHVHNTGSAFGLFRDNNVPLIVVSVIGVAVLALVYSSQERPGWLLRFSVALMLGGALGNLIDRVLLGHVTDFIDIGPWPVFNLADASIVSGLALLAWCFLMQRNAERTAAINVTDYSACPICDGLMISLTNGAKCADCGVRERIVVAGDD